MAAVMKWGIDDCVTDLFGDDAHEKITWLKKDHNDMLLWILSLTEAERWQLFRQTAEGQGMVMVDDAEPGDGAIGVFSLGLNYKLNLPVPWFAQMGVDHLWYARMPSGIRVVNYDGTLEVYRCPPLP